MWCPLWILGGGGHAKSKRRHSVKHRSMNTPTHLVSLTNRTTWRPRQASLKPLSVWGSVGRLVVWTQTAQPLTRIMCIHLQMAPARNTTRIYQWPSQCCLSSLEDRAGVDNRSHKGASPCQVLSLKVEIYEKQRPRAQPPTSPVQVILSSFC